MSFSWTGRQLDRITKSDGTVVSFTYDANGMRTEKTVGDEIYGYVWQNGKLIAETYVNGTDSREVYYIYDKNGSPVAWSYLDEYYYYIKNQQGDILGFTDSEGNVVVTYEYDAWGNLLYYTGTSCLAEYNGLRYRGYAYDNETGLYYLQSRYYDPKVGRFLNADDTNYLGASGTVLGFNLYAYCENNGVNKNDTSGNATFKLVAIGLQLEINIGMFSFGFELIFTKNNGIKSYLFKYKGGSMGAGIINSIVDIAKGVTKNLKKLFSYSLSLCFMAIFSKKAFNAKTYEGPTDTAYVVTWGSILGWGINTKTFGSAYGDYRSVGIGFTNSMIDVGYSRVHYTDISYVLKNIGSGLNSIYSTIYNKVSKLKP